MKRRAAIFMVFETLNKAIPFLMMPILTRYLTPTDYGFLTSFNIFSGFVGIIIGLSAHGAIEANYFKFTKTEMAKYISNIFSVLIVTFVLALLLVSVFHDYFYIYTKLPFYWQVVALVVALAQFITLINLTLWILERNPKSYGIYQMSQTCLIIALSLVLIVYYDYNWQGQVVSSVIGNILFAFVSLILLIKRGYLSAGLNRVYIYDFLKFGLPMILHQISNFAKGQGDKLILISLLGVSATGLFAVGHQIGLIMGILVASLHKAYYPTLFEKLSSYITRNDKMQIVKYTYVFFFGLIVFAFILICSLCIVYPYLVGNEFQETLFLTQLIIIAFVFDGMYYAVSAYIFYQKETSKLANITFSIAIFHLTMSYFAIQLFGYIGAGYVLVVSHMIQFFAVWYLSNKVYPMPWFSFWRIKNS